MNWRHLVLIVMGGFFAWLAVVTASDVPRPLVLVSLVFGGVAGVGYGRGAFLPSFRAAAAGRRAKTGVAPFIPLAILVGIYLVPLLLPALGVLGPLVILAGSVMFAVSCLYTLTVDLWSMRPETS